MAIRQVDPARLEGDALRLWYLRSPQQIEEERRAGEARAYNSFHSNRELSPHGEQLAWAVNGIRSAEYAGAASEAEGMHSGSADLSLTQRPQAVHPISAPAMVTTRGSFASRGLIPAHVPRLRPDHVVRSVAYTDTTQPSRVSQAFGGPQMYVASEEEIEDLRRQQTEFSAETEAEGQKNSWMLGPVLAPAVAVLGLEAGAQIAGAALIPRVRRAVSGLLKQRSAGEPVPEAPQPSKPQPGPRLTNSETGSIRDQARAKYARANSISASEMEAQVHHRISLEFSHVMPRADPNRLANLIALKRQAHDIASREWAAFSRSLAGREPTQAELVAVATRIDKMIEPYILRAGVPRGAPTPPSKGTP